MEFTLKTALLLYATAMGVLIISYLPRLVCWTYARHKQEKLKSTKKNRLALLIPARNESASIGALLDSIKKQTYPKACFDTHVIVADENDKTLEMIKSVDAVGYVVANQTCKGDALDACLKSILRENPNFYDAYIIVDADCVLDESFCEEMNNALSKGTDVVCAKKRVKNYYYGKGHKTPLSACCNGIIWTLIDNMGNCYKSEHGLPCFTVGTGLMLRSNIVKDNGGWPYRETVTEDMEFMQDCVVKGWKMSYYQHAILYMEEAEDLEVTNKRRRRWMTGVVDSARIYSEPLQSDPKREEKRSDIYHVRCLNRVYAMMGISALFSLVNFFIAVSFVILSNAAWRYALVNMLSGIGFIYASFFAMTLTAIIADYENIKLPFYKKLVLLFAHPVFYMKYIEIVATATFTDRGRVWDAIDRVDFGAESELLAKTDNESEKSDENER